jgi:hypothetical protein
MNGLMEAWCESCPLERELQKKETAHAEAATLLMLAK